MFKRIAASLATVATAITLAISGAIPAQAAALKPPTKMAVTAGDEQLTVTWKKASGAGGYLAQVSPGDQQCTATSSKTTCTITGLTNGIAYTVSLYTTKKSVKSTAVTKTNLKPASKLLTIKGTLKGTLKKTDKTDCSTWTVAQKSNATPQCALRVVALTANGQLLTSAWATSSTKNFTISEKVSNSQRASVTLHLMRGDGSYVGPVLLKSNTAKKQANNSLNASGNANKVISLGTVDIKQVSGQTAYATTSKAMAANLLNTAKTVSLVKQSDNSFAPAGAGKAGFVDMGINRLSAAAAKVMRAAETDPCASANTAGGDGIVDQTCYLGIIGFLNSPDGSQAPFTAAQFTSACLAQVGKSVNQIIADDPNGCGNYVSKLFAGSINGGGGDNGGGGGFSQLTKCAAFGLTNDGAGFISADCYDEANTQLGTVSESMDQYCPAKADLVGLPKSEWVATFGQEASFNCLQMLQMGFGLGQSQNGGVDCSQANPGADTDGDGIPNALDVDDNGDLIIDMADPNNLNGCSIEPAKGVRTTINNPLNYGMVGVDGYSVTDLNADINTVLSGSDFGIAYYAYKNEFFPNSKQIDGTLPAVWITCPGVIWCDPATSRATLGTGVEQLNARISLLKAEYVAAAGQTPARIKYTYAGSVDPVAGSQLQIDGFDNPAYNYSNIDVVSINTSSKTFLMNAPEKYCVYSNGSNAILNLWETCETPQVDVGPDSFASGNEVVDVQSGVWATFANRDYAPGPAKTWFSFASSVPFTSWSSKTENNNTVSKWHNSSCANDQGLEDSYVSAELTANTKKAAYESAFEADPNSQATNDAWNQYQQADQARQEFKKDRLFRQPCWSELPGPMQFAADSDQDANCQTGMNLNPGYTNEIKSQFALPTEKVNYLWQTKCVGPTFTYSVNAAFISPNVSRLAVNEDNDPSNNISAKDALSATDVLRLNYYQNDGTIGSVATTIGSYPITAPMVTEINDQTVDYSARSAAKGIDRTLGSYGSGYSDGNGDYYPHAAVIGASGDLKVKFNRPQREAFPGENTSVTDDNARFHDVYGLSYGLEFEMASTLAGCGPNYMAGKQTGMPIGPNMYDSNPNFEANVSADSGAAYLAPMKDAVTDSADKAPASESLTLNLNVVDCFKQRVAEDRLRDLQLPYGARTDGTASSWMPSGVSNGDNSCVSAMLNARGEAKTGGTDTSGQQICLQFAPGTLVEPNQAGDNVKYLYPQIGWQDYSTVNGVNSATIHLKNVQNFADSCTFSGSVTATDGGDAPTIVTWKDGALVADGLSADKNYSVEVTASNCIDSMPAKVLSSTALGDYSFTYGQNSGGGGNGGGGGTQCNDPNGCCNQNCGGGGNQYAFGNAYTTQGGYKVYLYGYSPTDGNTWTFSLQKVNGTPSVNMQLSATPIAEEGGSGIYYLTLTGFSWDLSDDGTYVITAHATDGSGNSIFKDSPEPSSSVQYPFDTCYGDCSPFYDSWAYMLDPIDSTDIGFMVKMKLWRNDLTYTWSLHSQSDGSVVQGATLQQTTDVDGNVWVQVTGAPAGQFYLQYVAKDSNGNEKFGGAQKSIQITYSPNAGP